MSLCSEGHWSVSPIGVMVDSEVSLIEKYLEDGLISKAAPGGLALSQSRSGLWWCRQRGTCCCCC